MNLVIDFGNTQTKVATFEKNGLKEINLYPKSELHPDHLSKIYGSDDMAIVSSVVLLDENWMNWMNHEKVLVLNEYTKIPLVNCYASPKTLGKDRLANAVGLANTFPSQNALAIDFGTCIKYDVVSEKGEYLGGAISPGLEMRFNSLHHFTDKLPQVGFSEGIELIGTDTTTSMQSGVQNGILNEIRETIAQYKLQFKDLKVVFTGGDAYHFETAFKKTIFARPNLTLEGLNKILEFNA